MKRTVIACNSEGIKENIFSNCCKKIDEECTSPKLIIFFSDFENLWYYAKKIKEKYPDTVSIGSSTYTFFSSYGIAARGLTAIAINSGIECSCGQIYEINKNPNDYVEHIRKAVKELSSTDNTCCLEFSTAFSKTENLVLDTLQKGLKETNIPVIGGTASAGQNQRETAVALNGDIFINTSVFVLIHNLEGRIIYYNENAYKKTDLIFTVTEIDCDEQKVYQFDNKPASTVLSRSLNVEPEQLCDRLLSSPLGCIFGDKVYTASIDKVYNDNSISFFSRIYNQTKMTVLKQMDLNTVWTQTAQYILSQIQNPSFVISINSIFRTMIFEKEQKLGDFVSKLLDFYENYIGMSSYSEQVNQQNLNQTMSLLVFE